MTTSVETKEEDNDKSRIDLWDILISNKKILATWGNIFEYFKHCENKLTENLINLFNDKYIIDNLIKEEPLSDEDRDNKNGNYDVVHNLYSCILKSENLLLKSYSALMEVCPWYYSSLTKYDISTDKMSFLITKKKISLTKENYAGVKSSCPALIPQFISIRFSDFIKNELELDFSVEDAISLLDCDELTETQKRLLLTTNFIAWKNLAEKNYIMFVAKKIIELSFSDKSVININLLVDSLESETDLIKIITLQQKYLKANYIAEVISNKFSDVHKAAIEKKGKTKKIPFSVQMLEFYKVLEVKDLISTCEQKDGQILIHQKRK